MFRSITQFSHAGDSSKGQSLLQELLLPVILTPKLIKLATTSLGHEVSRIKSIHFERVTMATKEGTLSVKFTVKKLGECCSYRLK